MSLFTDTLSARLVAFLEAHDPTRVLVAGIPDFLIEQIAVDWNSGFELLLVTGAPVLGLPANVINCRADDLTAARQHAWAALISAAESRSVQESIRSAGAGTVREIWGAGFPWIPCDLPTVRWRDVRDSFIERIGLVAEKSNAGKCIDQFREELRGEVDAGTRFYTALDGLNDPSTSYEDLCYQLGFPAHEISRNLRKRSDSESVLALLDRFVERFNDEIVDDARDHFIDIAKTRLATESGRCSRVEAAIKGLAARYRQLAPADAVNPVRAWKKLFDGERDQWAVLSADTLALLLVSEKERPTFAELELGPGNGTQLFDIGPNQIIARDRNASPVAIGAIFTFSDVLVREAAQAAAAQKAWRLFGRANRSWQQLANALPPGKGPHKFEVSLQTEGKQTIRFNCGPTSNDERATSKPILLWECCQDYPLIIASPHTKIKAAKRKRSKDEKGDVFYEVVQDLRLPTQGKVALHGFIYGLSGTLLATKPGETPGEVSNLVHIQNSQCKEFVLNAEVLEGSELTFAWTDSSGVAHRAIVSLDFKGDPEPRDDSVVTALGRAHSAGGKAIREYWRKLKDGKPVESGLLPVKDTAKQIGIVERRNQNVENGWWPHLATLDRPLSDQVFKPVLQGFAFASTAVNFHDQANAWKSVIESSTGIDPIPPEFSIYATARKRIIEALGAQFQLSPGESADELNLVRRGGVGVLDKELIESYVRAYVTLLEQMALPGVRSSWRWRAWAIDTLVLFPSQATGPVSHLLGPFHPITLARLYYVEKCLGDRLIEDEPSPLAQAFLETQPLSQGTLLDAQLQPVPGIAFPSGELYWLWIYQQEHQSGLPSPELVEWLRDCGLDPQTGPLGVDAEILPQTLRQYLVAYPSRQTVRLSLDDCSQRSFEVLRDELTRDSDSTLGGEALGAKLPGGISVYDPITQVKRVEGARIAFDPDLPLRWHHARAPEQIPIDLSTLPRSNVVNRRAGPESGASSSQMPTARRNLVDYDQGGMQVFSAVSPFQGQSSLEAAVSDAIRCFEPANQVLSWGTSLSLNTPPRANWTLCSAGQVDPRLFIAYVRANPGTSLWTYRLFSIGASKNPEFGRGHFLIARLSNALASSLKNQLVGTGLSTSPESLLAELAEAGLTLGDEFLRTGRTAEGAVGQYLVQRLVWQPGGMESPVPHWTLDSEGRVQSAGFLLQVDPFTRLLDVLAKLLDQSSDNGDLHGSRQRSDLVSVHVILCGDKLWIRPVVIESKLLRSGQPDLENAYAQACATAELFDKLLDYCQASARPHDAHWSQPERLFLAELIHLGLRLARGSFPGDPAAWRVFESIVLSRLLSGDFNRDDAGAIVIVHSPTATTESLDAAQPHAFVSFGDADLAGQGTPPTSYRELRTRLSALVRHTCSPGMTNSSQVPPPPPVTKTETAPIITAPISPAPSEDAESKGNEGVPLPPQSPEIEKAHNAFDHAFSDFIGNRQAIEKLRDDIVDALIKRPPHLPSAYILTGNPSTGKTTLANKVAALLDVTFVKLVGTNIRSEADLVKQVDNAFQVAGKKPTTTAMGSQGLPEHEYPECLIFIDEIHLVKGRAQEGLLTLTEPKDRYIRLTDRICRFPKATYMAATTRDSEIDQALRTRFGNPIHLSDYSVSEVARMLAVKRDDWSAWPETIREGIARLSRCVPREAERLAQKLDRKIAVSRERLSVEAALEKLRLEEGLDRNGLDHVRWEMLRHLAKQNRAVGRETLAKQLGITDEEKMVSEVIPNLQSLGLVAQVQGGQVITDRGRNYLRNEAPPGG
jgi:Holliday junction resolvasome RuvABC ATP-dependent DNA helicase subunit